MKIRSVLNLALAVLGQACPTLAVDPLLQPSITPFTEVPSSLVEVEGVAYYGYLKTPPLYIGNSPGVSMWFKSMNRDFYDIGKKQEALREEQDFYIESVKDLGGIVITRLKRTTQAQLDALGPGTALDAILAYSKTHLLVQEAVVGEQKAWKLLDAAMKEVDDESLVIVERDLLKEQGDKQKEKAAIIQKAKDAGKTAGLFGKVISLVKTAALNPASIKGELMSEAVGGVTDLIEEILINNVLMENMEVMRAIDGRLTAIDNALKIVSPGIHQTRLNAKRDRLAAARLAVMEAGIKRKLASVEAIDKIDVLTSMERGVMPKLPESKQVFAALQSYFEEMRMSEARIRKAANNYLEAINQGAPAMAQRLAKDIRKDIADVRTRPDADPNRSSVDARTLKWLWLASSTGEYMESQARWYQDERQRVQDVLVSLETGRHLDFVQSSMATLAQRAGSTR